MASRHVVLLLVAIGRVLTLEPSPRAPRPPRPDPSLVLTLTDEFAKSKVQRLNASASQTTRSHNSRWWSFVGPLYDNGYVLRSHTLETNIPPLSLWIDILLYRAGTSVSQQIIIITVGSSSRGVSSSRIAHHTASPKKITTAAVATRSTCLSFNVGALLL